MWLTGDLVSKRGGVATSILVVTVPRCIGEQCSNGAGTWDGPVLLCSGELMLHNIISSRCGSTIGNNSFLAVLNDLEVLFAAGDIPVNSADSDLQ